VKPFIVYRKEKDASAPPAGGLAAAKLEPRETRLKDFTCLSHRITYHFADPTDRAIFRVGNFRPIPLEGDPAIIAQTTLESKDAGAMLRTYIIRHNHLVGRAPIVAERKNEAGQPFGIFDVDFPSEAEMIAFAIAVDYIPKGLELLARQKPLLA
jgi:hypothetical protein